jgi:hypothetical protein
MLNTDVQRATTILEHIEEWEKVLKLNQPYQAYILSRKIKNY